jgi:hypothetical protein
MMPTALFVGTYGSGEISTIKQHIDWDQWLKIVPGDFGGSHYTDLLFYYGAYFPSVGRGLFARTDGSGNVLPIKQHNNWDPNWSHIVPYRSLTGVDVSNLLFYKFAKGEALFAKYDRNGDISTIKKYNDWDKGWHTIVSGRFGGDKLNPDVFFYKREAGLGLFATIHTNGTISTIRRTYTWKKDWDIIIAGNFGGEGGNDDLLLYKSGLVLLVSVDANGNISTFNIREGSLYEGWHEIVPGYFGGDGITNLLFYGKYGPKASQAMFVRVDYGGILTPFKTYSDWDPGWDTIVPGLFGGPRGTDLLFWKRV